MEGLVMSHVPSFTTASRYFIRRVGVAAGIVLLVTGCSASALSAKPKPSSSVPPHAGTASASSSPTGPAGSKLNAQLLPASALPPGFTLVGSRDDGNTAPYDLPHQVSAGQACQLLEKSAWIQVSGLEPFDYAQGVYANAGHTGDIDQEIFALTGNDSATAMAAMWKVFGECGSFTYQFSSGPTAHFTLKRTRLTGIGDEAITGVQTAPELYGGSTLVAVRVGSVIITTTVSSSGSDRGSAAVDYATGIAKNVAAAHLG
jgi:hypothetical protein